MFKFYHLLPLAVGLALVSCIADEPLNAECDIESVWLHADSPDELFYHPYDTLQVVPSAETEVCFQTRMGSVPGAYALSVTITPRAQVYLVTAAGEQAFANGTMLDFADGQTHTLRVRSESGKYQREYTISVAPKAPSSGDMLFDFEHYVLAGGNRYYLFEQPDAPTTPWWACGNPGYRLSVSSAKAESYPTTPVQEGVDGGTCVRLTTCDTGGFGRMVNMRLAAGNLFIGTFDVANALKDALAATQFGIPYPHKPLRIFGYYKFKRGAVMQDRDGNAVEDEVDWPDIYCVVYRNTDADGNQVRLDGADVLDNPNIVGIARIDPADVDITGTWRHFDLPVVYTTEISRDDVVNELYSITVCFSSSVKGARFEGAVGSTLWVDNVALECEY